MISTRKSINFDNKHTFTIPIKWRKKFDIVEGVFVKIRVQNNYIFIEPSQEDTVDVLSIVGRRGSIYIPKEIRNYFHRKGMKKFYVYVDEGKQVIIMKPNI